MTALGAPAVIAVLLGVSGLCGPLLLRAAAPLLMRIPRLAVALLLAGMAAWLLAAAALSLVLAWSLSGPRLLPGAYGEVCQRCLAASSPFAAGHTVQTGLPVALLMLLPALGATLLLGRVLHHLLASHRQARSLSARIVGSARRTRVAGHEVWLLRDARPLAFALPRSKGGIVISDGLRGQLADRELTAVLAHEQAHLQQRHHLILSVLGAVTEPLRWIPLARAIADAAPHYLEIAADSRARACSGTPALASALLKIGAPAHPGPLPARPGGPAALLHAGGPDRIRQLVAPARGGAALAPLSALALLMLGLTIVTICVHLSYLQVMLAGCVLPE